MSGPPGAKPGYDASTGASAGAEPSAAFTPGPWRVEGGGANIFDEPTSLEVIDADFFPVAEVPIRPIINDWFGRFPEMPHWADGADDGRTLRERAPGEVLANARLIAAAPELLATLQDCLGWHDFADDLHKPIEVRAAYMRARTAIAKALGLPAADTTGVHVEVPGRDQ